MKRLFIYTLLVIILTAVFFSLNSLLFFVNSTALAGDYSLKGKEKIGEGTHLYYYDLQVNNDVLPVRKLVVDLHNPYVDIQAMHPKEGFNNRQTVREMAADQDAVAAVNADFFNLTKPAAPFGLHIEDGEIISSPSYNRSWLGFGIDKDNTAHILNWIFDSKIILDGQTEYPLYAFNHTYRNEHAIFLYDRRWGEEVSSTFFDDPVLQVTVIGGRVANIEKTEESVPVPREGFVLIAEGYGADFLKQQVEAGSEINFELGLDPDTDLKTSVGGHVVLVDNGEPADPGKLPSPGSSRASRTAVGIGSQGKKVYFVTVDAASSASGITMEELASFLSDLGIERALNLDGGGSTTMVARKLGSFEPELVSQPRHIFERSLPNAIGIFNRAPRTEAKRLFLQGEENLLIGTEDSYEVSGYDKHYHPLDIDPQELEWEVSDEDLAEVIDGNLKAKKPGELDLLVTYQGITEVKRVEIFGGEDIEDFYITPEEIKLLPGQEISLDVQIETLTGLTLEAGADTVTWEADIGYVKNNTYYAEEEGFGALMAEIDGHIKEIPLLIGGKRILLFDFREGEETAFRSHPEGLPGSFTIERDADYVYRGERSGRLEYDFSEDLEEVMIAYGQLNSGEISMGTNNLGVSAYIYGDKSGYWLRAEVFDAEGNRHFVDLADEVDWEGWRRVRGEFNPGWKQPLTLSSIYLVRRPEDRADSPKTGTIYMDQVEMIKELEAGDKKKLESQHDVEMWIGSTEYRQHGELRSMDAVPFIEDGRTLVPVRFLGYAFDAGVDWTPHPETGLTEKVRLKTEEVTVEINIGDDKLVVLDRISGEETTFEMDVLPQIKEGRTYLPFRAIGEHGFDAQVGYETGPDTNRVDSVWFNSK